MILLKMAKQETPPRFWAAKLVIAALVVGFATSLLFGYMDLDAIGSINIQIAGKTSETINETTLSTLFCGDYITAKGVGFISGLAYIFLELLAFAWAVMKFWREDAEMEVGE